MANPSTGNLLSLLLHLEELYIWLLIMVAQMFAMQGQVNNIILQLTGFGERTS